MTVAPTSSSPNPWAEFGGAGMEDTSTRDIQLPRLKIDGPGGVLVNSVTGEQFQSLNMIFLGLIKQRSFFLPLTRETEKLGPVCKSNDFDAGFPSEPFTATSPIFFPWAQAGFDPTSQAKIDPETGRVRLSCEDCQMKEWQDRNAPPCNEVHTYPVLYQNPDTQSLVPAIFQVKSSGIKNSRNMISAFKTADRPMFTAWVQVTLTPGRRGSVIYAVPNFAPLFAMDQMTDQSMWRDWYNQLQVIRDAQRQPPRPFEDLPVGPDSTAGDPNTITGEVDTGSSPWGDYADATPDASPVWPVPAPVPAPPVAAPAPVPPSAPVLPTGDGSGVASA